MKWLSEQDTTRSMDGWMALAYCMDFLINAALLYSAFHFIHKFW